MTQKLLSAMASDELIAELKRCREAGLAAIADGLINESRVWEQRFYLARSYLLDPRDIQLDATYGLSDSTALFVPRYLHGIVAYGRVLGEKEERGYPIGQLVPLDFSDSST